MSAEYDAPDLTDQEGPLDALDAALDDLSAVFDRLERLTEDLTGLADARVEDGLRRYVTECRREPVLRNALVSEVIERALPITRRAGSTAIYLRDLVRVSIGEGRGWERDALDLVPRRAITSGELLPPHRPAVAAAIAAGAISTAHARTITATLARVPAAVGYDAVTRAEVKLVRFACKHDPVALRRRCDEVAEALDPDGSLGSTREHRDRVRGFSIGRQDQHGMYPVRGRLDPECGAKLVAALAPLAAPVPGPDGERDPRTAEQRNHDALSDFAHRLLAAGGLPERHGLPGKLIVTMTLQQLEEQTGTASTIHGGRLPVRDVIRLAAELVVIPAVLDSDGTILHFGREQRTATLEQRLAEWILDGGCTFEACTVPAALCQSAHTGEGFRITRTTTIDELGLLCGYHHRLVDNQGYRMARVDNRIWITPPKWIDPDQFPRTNEHFKPLQN